MGNRAVSVRRCFAAYLQAFFQLHMLHRSGVKSSRAAVVLGWVTTVVSRLASVWRGLGGVSRRIARFWAC